MWIAVVIPPSMLIYLPCSVRVVMRVARHVSFHQHFVYLVHQTCTSSTIVACPNVLTNTIKIHLIVIAVPIHARTVRILPPLAHHAGISTY